MIEYINDGETKKAGKEEERQQEKEKRERKITELRKLL